MDIANWLEEHAAGLPLEKRLEVYEKLRVRINLLAATADQPQLRERVELYKKDLEETIRQFEQAQVVASSRPPGLVAPASHDAPMFTGGVVSDGAPAAPLPQPRSLAQRALPMIVGAIVGVAALLAYQAYARSPVASIVQAYDEGLAASDVNIAMLRELKDGLERHRAENRTFPVASEWRAFAAVAAPFPGLMSQLARLPGQTDKLLYRGSASDYKVILHYSGDCFIVGVRAPNLIDPIRAAGKVDCFAFGFWTDGAKNW
jgi:hypothetical protein